MKQGEERRTTELYKKREFAPKLKTGKKEIRSKLNEAREKKKIIKKNESKSNTNGAKNKCVKTGPKTKYGWRKNTNWAQNKWVQRGHKKKK